MPSVRFLESWMLLRDLVSMVIPCEFRGVIGACYHASNPPLSYTRPEIQFHDPHTRSAYHLVEEVDGVKDVPGTN